MSAVWVPHLLRDSPADVTQIIVTVGALLKPNLKEFLNALEEVRTVLQHAAGWQ